MEAAFVAEDGPAGTQRCCLWPTLIHTTALTGMALAFEACSRVTELTVLTESLSVMLLFSSMQRSDFC